jgi:hypothetical protein
MALKPKAVRKSTVRKSITIHPSITAERVLAAVESQFNSLDDPGFCIACGTDQEGCEPDMRRGYCESCGERAVFGAEELLIRFA